MSAIAIDPEILLAHESRLRGLVRGLLRDEQEVDDVIQQTFAATMGRPPRDRRKLGAFMGAVARNFARKTARRESRLTRREHQSAEPEAVPSAADIAAREETRRTVVTAVLALDEPYRSALILRWFEDLSPKQIAARLNEPASTIRTRLQRGLEKLKVRLDKIFGGRRAWVVALVPLLGAGEASAAIAVPWAAVLAATAAGVLGLGVLGYATHSAPPPSTDADPLAGVAPPPVVSAAAAAPEPPPLAPLGPDPTTPVGERGARAAEAPAPAPPPPAATTADSAPRMSATGIWGRALDADGCPVAGVELLIGARVQFPNDPDRTQLLANSVATTDAAGRWVLEPGEIMSTGGPPGRWAIPARPEETVYRAPGEFWFRLTFRAQHSRWTVADQAVRLAQPGDGRLQVQLRARSGIRLHFVDAAAHTPVDGVTVAGGLLRTDGAGDGRAVYYSLPGTYAVTFTAPGYAPATVSITLPRTGIRDRLDPVLLYRGLSISGTVRDRDGTALEAILLAECAATGSVPPVFTQTRSGSDGTFRLSPLGPGRYRLICLRPGAAPVVRDLELQDAPLTADLTLLPVGEAGPPVARPYRWEDRRTVHITLKSENLDGLEMITWVETILGCALERSPEAEARFSGRAFSLSFNDTPPTAMFRFFCDVTGVTFDPVRGRFDVPKK